MPTKPCPYSPPGTSAGRTAASALTARHLCASCLRHCLLAPTRRTLHFLVVFILLLCAAESLLSLAVYMGYEGNSYLRRVRWHRDGRLTFAEFQAELARTPESREWSDLRPGGGGVEYGADDADCGDGDGGGGGGGGGDCNGVTVHLPPCPLIPPASRGPVAVDTRPPPSFLELEERFSMLEAGGRYRPPDCVAAQKLAVILPYRDRRVHLKIFLTNMHPFLQKQQLDYAIFVVELKQGIPFNRALLFNIGFTEALKLDNFTCFIFHDVDLLPEDDRNLYKCSEHPMHMSVAVDRMKYRLPYKNIFGGVSALTGEHFRKVNGFSNLYFGWGGEDDDMYHRLRNQALKIVRYTSDVARYKSMAHAKADKNPSRVNLLRQGHKRFKSDGLNSLNYTRLDLQLKQLYTWIYITVDQNAYPVAAAARIPVKRKPHLPHNKKKLKV